MLLMNCKSVSMGLESLKDLQDLFQTSCKVYSLRCRHRTESLKVGIVCNTYLKMNCVSPEKILDFILLSYGFLSRFVF